LAVAASGRGGHADSLTIAFTLVMWGPLALLAIGLCFAASVKALVDRYHATWTTVQSGLDLTLVATAWMMLIIFWAYVLSFPAHHGTPGGF
jgi:hypothetical protein